MKSHFSRTWGYWLGGMLLLLFGACLFPPVGWLLSVFVGPVVILAWRLTTGWVTFLTERVAEASVSGGLIVLAAVSLALLLFGVHGVMSRRLKPWSKRSTFAVVFLLVLMFWAGVATVGIVHHVAWMTQDPDPVMKLENGLISKRLQSTNNLSQLGRAIQIHHDIDGTFPAGAIFAADGRPLHGWQTLILPNLDLAALSRRIDRSRPWNDPVNAAAIQTPIRAYLNPAFQRDQKGRELGDAVSHYSANGWVIGGDRGKNFAEITDGLSQTLLIGEINDRIRPWGEPVNWRDPAKGLNRVPGGFGSPFPGLCHFVFASGHGQSLSDKIDPDVLRRLAHPDDGESLVDEDWSD